MTICAPSLSPSAGCSCINCVIAATLLRDAREHAMADLATELDKVVRTINDGFTPDYLSQFRS